MNPVTFNEPFERVIQRLGEPLRSALENNLGRWRTSPLFVHETNVKEERDFILGLSKENTPGEMMPDIKWPFTVVRLALTEEAVPGEDTVPVTCNMVLSRVSYEEIIVFTHYLDVGMSQRRWRELEPIFTLSISSQGMGNMVTKAYIKNCWSREILGNQRQPEDNRVFKDVPEDAIRAFATSRIAAVAAFMVTATSPRIHIATVEPVVPGKSVEWQRARLHYTFISHGHPANKAGITQGSEVTSNSVEELKRLAHDRRGHWRTYRHKRYRFMKGERKWIKAMWVGPKEWRSAGGKQIYRILEPVVNG